MTPRTQSLHMHAPVDYFCRCGVTAAIQGVADCTVMLPQASNSTGGPHSPGRALKLLDLLLVPQGCLVLLLGLGALCLLTGEVGRLLLLLTSFAGATVAYSGLSLPLPLPRATGWTLGLLP